MLEKTCFNLPLVDDLKAGDLFSDKRFKDIVISNQSKFIFAFSNIMQNAKQNIFENLS